MIGRKKAELLIMMTIFFKLSFVNSGHHQFCLGFGGHSPGVKDFCDFCAGVNNDLHKGLSLFHTGGGTFGGFFKLLQNRINPVQTHDEFVDVTITSIEIDKKPLYGWFHIKLVFPTKRPVYAFALEMENNDTRFAMGEFTTDLLGYCNKGGWKDSETPTEFQILPCHATPANSPQHANAVGFWRLASSEFIKKGTEITMKEFHVNWKIPNGHGCAFTKRFLLRVIVMTMTPEDVAKPNEPTYYTSTKRFVLILPDFSSTNQFNGPAPLPLFITANQVDCLVPILNKPDNTDNTKPYYKDTDPINRYCNYRIDNDDPISTWSCHPKASKYPCVQSGGIKIFNSGKSYDEGSNKPLYVGRCESYWPHHFKPFDATFNLDYVFSFPSVPFQCVNISEINLDVYGKDLKYMETHLNTMENYIKHFRYDKCNCPVTISTGGNGGSLNIKENSRLVLPSSYSSQSQQDSIHIEEFKSRFPHMDFNTLNSMSKKNHSNVTTKSNKTALVKTLNENILNKVKLAWKMHSVFNAIAFLFFIPVGIFIVRYLKESFYGKSLLMYDTWYTLHVCGVVQGAIACIFLGNAILCMSKLWSSDKTIESHNQFAALHGYIGWFVIVLYVIVVTFGGIRVYNPNSNTSLKFSIGLHGILGLLLYYMGLITMIVYLIHKKDMYGHLVVVAWIVIDIIFHIIMTIHVKRMDRQFKLNRSVFPVMELIIDDMNAPGKLFRMIMLFLYIIVSVVITGAFIFLAVNFDDVGFMHSNITSVLKPDRADKY